MTAVSIKHIEIDDRGIARIAGSRMKVIHLVLDKMAHNSTPEEMAREFPPLTLAQIHAAFSYYYDNKAELDAQIAETFAADDRARNNPAFQVSKAELLARLHAKNSQTSGTK